MKVEVGADKKCFFVHPSILSQSSEFFAAALKKEWREGQNRSIQLAEYEKEIFELYLRWLYSGKIFVKNSGEDSGYPTLAKLYVLGEKIMDSEFQDRVIDAMIAASLEKDEEGWTYHPDSHPALIIYEGTSEGSPARGLIINEFVAFGRDKWITKEAQCGLELNEEFVRDLITALLDRRVLPANEKAEYKSFKNSPGCKYHKHGKDQPCGPQQQRKRKLGEG